MMTDDMKLCQLEDVQLKGIQSIPATALPVMEHFYTLQGEGFHWGRAAYFVRLAGCDVGCVWCDVKESWDASNHPRLSFDYLAANSMLKSFNRKQTAIKKAAVPLVMPALAQSRLANLYSNPACSAAGKLPVFTTSAVIPKGPDG